VPQDGYETGPASGSIITTTSLDPNLRGQQHTRMDGSIIRPSLVLPATRRTGGTVQLSVGPPRAGQSPIAISKEAGS